MGDAHSTQRESRQDAAAEEDSKEGHNPQTEQNTKHETLSEQSSDISRKGDKVKLNGCHEEESGAQGLPLIPTKEAAPETQENEEESQGEVDADDGVHLDITGLDVKQNDINSLGRFFSNIGLKLTINRGSAQNKEAKTQDSEETKTAKREDNTAGGAKQDCPGPTCPILTAVASEDADKTAETTEEPELKAEPEQEPHSTDPSDPGEVAIDSPIRRFFATGIFAGLWKKKEAEDETTEKELEETGENQVTETREQTAQERYDEEPTAPGSTLRRLSIKQRNIKSSDARLCDPGEHPAELQLSKPAEDHSNASAPTSEEGAKEGEGVWASFKRFMSPKPRMKISQHSAEETQQPASVEEPRAAQTSDHSSEEGKKRKNSSVSWEAVLCGSGRRRSRKTSDSEDEMSPINLKYHKEDSKPKSGGESGAENEKEPTSPKLDRRPQEDDGGSTWKSLKRIVTPKKKSRDEDEAIKIKIQSDGEGGQQNSSFSIKNLLPGRKKQMSGESQSDEAEKDLASEEEDSETPGVVPLSEFEVDEQESKNLGEKEKLELQQDQGADVDLCFSQDFKMDSENQDTNEGQDNIIELASRHHQLCDIQEEGGLVEPWATLVLFTKEAEGRDDPTVEDLIEVPSEAITAAEPAADLTLRDETEMFTAASQLSSESATTSSNATPVLAERRIFETDTVLHQVAEAFSTSPQTKTPEPKHTFKGCVKIESTTLEMHRRADAMSTETRLTGEKLEALNDCTGLMEESPQLVEASKTVEEPELSQAASSLASDKGNATSVETEHKADNIPKEELGAVENINKSTFTKDTLELEEASTLSKPEVMTAVRLPEQSQIILKMDLDTDEDKIETKLTTEHTSEPLDDGKNVCTALHVTPKESEHPSLAKEAACNHVSEEELAPDEPKQEIILSDTNLQSRDPYETVKEPETSQVLQQLLELPGPEITSENILTEETVPDENKEKRKLCIEITLELEVPSETDGKAKVIQVLQQSLESEETIEEPPDISGEETVPDGPGDETTAAGESSSEPVEDSKTAEVVEERETVETSSLVREESSTSAYEPEETSENTESDKDEKKAETFPHTEYLTESEDAARVLKEPEESKTVLQADCQTPAKEKTAADEPQDVKGVSTERLFERVDDFKTFQMSSFESEESSFPPSGPEASLENVLKAELDPDQDKRQTTLITEDASEPPDYPKKIEAAALSATVQPSSEGTEWIHVSSLEAEEICDIYPEAETGPDKTDQERKLDPKDFKTIEELESKHPSVVKEVTFDHFSKEDPVLNEPKQGATLSDTNPQSVDPSETDGEAQDLQMLQQSRESEESKEEPSDSIQETVPGERRDKTPATGETSSEPVDEFKTAEVELETLKTSSLVLEESRLTVKAAETSSQTVQSSSGQSEDNSVSPAEPEVTSEIILTEETVSHEPKEALKLSSDITLEAEEPSETEGEAELLKDVHPQSSESEESRGHSPEAELTSDNIWEETTDKPRDETPATGETSSEPVAESKTAEAVVELETVETSAFMSEESSRSTLTAEETYENIPKVGLDKVETQVETVLVMVEASESKPAEQPELSQTVQVSSLESEDSSIHSAEPEITSEILTEETVPDGPGDKTTAAGETSSEPVEDSKTAEVVEERETVETSSLVREESSTSAYEPEETFDNVLKTGSDVDENKVETSVSQTVQSSSGQSEDDSVYSAEPEIMSEIILKEETAPNGPGDETAAVGQETAEDVKETVQTFSQEEYKSTSPPPEAEETSDISKAKTISDETKKEITLDPEDTESAEKSEALTAVKPTPGSEHLAKEATCEHISGEEIEMVPGEPKEDTINEIPDAATPVPEPELTQGVITASLDLGELEVKSNNVSVETGRLLLSEVYLRQGDVQKTKVFKTVQVVASDETPENLLKAEAAREEDNLAVETTTDDLTKEHGKDDKCSGTEKETVKDEGPAATHVDKCHPRYVSEVAPDGLRGQTSEPLMDTMQVEHMVKEQVHAATPSARDGVAEEVQEQKAEDRVEEAAVDAGTTSEGTTVDSPVKVDVMEEKDVCCRVVHAVESLPANKQLVKEHIFEEEEVTTQEVKVEVDVEEKESTTVQATEASQSPPVTKAKDVDHDEWKDAEVNIDIPEERAGSFYEAKKPQGSQRGDEDVEQAGFEREVETAHASRIEGKGSEEMNKADEACGFKSEEEDIEVALEHSGKTSIVAVSLTG